MEPISLFPSTMACELHRRMAKMIEKYSTSFTPHISDSRFHDLEGHHVAVTGATGNVGCLMVQLLLEDPNVRTLYLLNRRNGLPAKERVVGAFMEKGLDPGVLQTSPTRIIYLEIDFSMKRLGLSDAEYADVRIHLLLSFMICFFDSVLTTAAKQRYSYHTFSLGASVQCRIGVF